MKALRNLIVSAILALSLVSPSFAAFPWGSTAPLQVSGGTPTCTYTATALACIEDMTANVTSLTLAGMTAGNYYTLILMQDGTGSRTLTQTAITSAPALSTAESAANGYAVWLIKATSASAASFVADYDNAPLWDTWKAAVTSNTGQAVANGATAQSAPTVIVPGMSASNACLCQPQALAATWQTGLVSVCVPLTNAVECELSNGTAATITATASTLNVRILP